MPEGRGERGEMLAAVYHGPNDLRVEDVPVPEIGKGEILVKVLSASICGTDLRIYHGNHRMYPPGTVRIPGHEVVGTIAGLGAEVTWLYHRTACILRTQHRLRSLRAVCDRQQQSMRQL